MVVVMLRFCTVQALFTCCLSLITLKSDYSAECPLQVDLEAESHTNFLQSKVATNHHANPGVDDNSSSYHLLSTQGLYALDSAQYGETTAYRAKIYAAPHDASDLLVYDTSTDALSLVSTASIVDEFVMSKFLGITAYRDKIYAPPANAAHILVYDVKSKQVSGVPTDSVAVGVMKWNGIAAWEGKLYAAPLSAETMLVYDIATGELSGIPTYSVCTGMFKWMGMVAHAGKLYAAPVDIAGLCDQMLVYDIGSGDVSGVSTAGVATGPWKWHGMAVLDNKVYAVPANAHALLIYDTETGEVSGASTRMLDHTDEHKWAGLMAHNGKLYGGPQMHEGILVYDPTMGNVSSLPVSSAVSESMPKRYGCMKNPVTPTNPGHRCGFWNGIAGWGDTLVCPPYDAATVLVYNLS